MNPELPTSPPGPPGPVPPPAPPAQGDLPAAPARGHGHAELLRAVQRRQRQNLWLEGLCWGTGALLVLLLLAGLVAASAPLLGRALLVLAPVGFAAALVVFGVFRAIARVGDEARTARLVGQRVPELSGDVLSAVELRRALEGTPSFSPELARAFVSATDDRLRNVTAHDVVDDRPLRRAVMVLSALVLACAVVGVLRGARWKAGMGTLLATRASAAEAPHHEPITGDVELTYRYPAYTGLAPRVVPGTGGDISAPAGTEVRLKTRADREVERARLQVNGQSVPLQVKGGRELEGGFVLSESGSYHFVFESRRGSVLARGPDVPIHVEPDTAPKVSLLTPAEEVEVSPDQRLVLKYEATDDYGLTELWLVFKKPGQSAEQRVPLEREDGRATRGQYGWEIASLGLGPGDRVTYHVEAKDNDAVAGKKKGVSRTQALKLYDAAEHRRAAMARVEALWEKLVLHLADRLEGPEGDAPPDLQKLSQAAQVDASGAELVTELRTAAQELSTQKDAPAELWTALVTVSDGLSRKVRQTTDARRQLLRQARTQGVGELSRRLDRAANEEISEAEKDVLYLESLLDRQKLQELKELARELTSERRELASLIEKYRQSPDEATKDAVMQQIQALRQRIDELMQRMAELAKGIRDEHINAEAMRELMQEQDMGAALDEIEKLMREGKAEEALERLQQLAMEMDEMLKSLDDADDRMGEEQYPELAQKFGELMQELEATKEAQEKLAQDTRGMRDAYKDRMKERLRQKGDQLKKELLREVKALEQEYRQVEAGTMGGGAEETLERLLSELGNLQRALDVTDFDLAAESAGTANRLSQEMAYRGQQQQQLDELWQNPPEVKAESKQLAGKLNKGSDRMAEVNRKLQELFPPPGAMLSESDRKKLDQMSQQQRQLQQRAQGLQQKMEEISQLAPIFDEEATSQMDDVAQRMGEAGQRMEGRDPGRAHGEQRAALDGLQQLQQQMQESGGKGGKGLPLPMLSGSRRSGMGNRPSQEKVEIPDEDQFQAPREFRKDLLDAMRQGAPEKYRDQVKRYYEELVK